MKKILIASIGFAAIQFLSAYSANATTYIANEPYCREYTQTFIIGHKKEKGYGTACLRPDGTWAIQKPAHAPVPAQVFIDQKPVTYVVQEAPVVVPAPVYVAPAPAPVVVIGDPYYNRYYHHQHYSYYRW